MPNYLEGDRVYYPRFGSGKIYKINPTYTFPILVKFDTHGMHEFYLDGRYNSFDEIGDLKIVTAGLPCAA